MKLDLSDRTNPLLFKLLEGWREELAALRARNDGPLTQDETLTLRGRIAQLKETISLADEPIVFLDE